MRTPGRTVLSLGLLFTFLVASRHPSHATESAYLDLGFDAVRDTIPDTTGPRLYMLAPTAPSSESMTFSLYSQRTGSSPVALWSQSIADVPIQAGGQVNVILGPISTSILMSAPILYLEIMVDHDLLTPRIPLVLSSGVLMMVPAVGNLESADVASPVVFSATPRTTAVGAIHSTGRVHTVVVFDGNGEADMGSTEVRSGGADLRVRELEIVALRSEIARLRARR